MDETGGHLESREVAAYLDRALRPAERERIESHLAGCAVCRHEVVAVARIRRGSTRGFRWLIALPAAAAAAVVLLLARPAEPPPGGLLRDSGSGLTKVELVAPSMDRAVAAADLTFTWRRVGDDVSYRLNLTDARGDVIWSTSAADTTAQLPTTIRLRSGVPYHWFVDALLPDGRSIASAVRAFTVQ
jgi:hypothetical protein